MLSNIWKSQYTLRRYSQQVIIDGYSMRGSQDYKVMLDVQPEVDSTVPTESGKRVTERLVSYGNFPVRVENVREGILADRLLYNGNWYECESSMWYEHLPISHYTARWVRITEAVNEEDLSISDESEGNGE